MAKRKGSSAPSSSRARKKAAKEGSDAKKAFEDECGKLRCEVRAIEGKQAKLLEKQRELEDQKRRLEEQLRPLEEQLQPLRREVEQVQRTLRTKRKRIEEVENAQHLDKLPQEVWEKILDELKNDDLFPLALSCRYFRQKQKELVARTRQHGSESGKRGLALKTNLWLKLHYGQPASAEYLRFCSKEKVRLAAKNEVRKKAELIRRLAAFHGHLPLLQELQAGLKRLDSEITRAAARGGQMETLQWLKTLEGFRLFPMIFASACKGGHMEIVRWLRSEGCPWDERACSRAVEGGHIEVLKWLRSEGCPWNADACSDAAVCGHLEVLKWLRSQDPPCPWNEETCVEAATRGYLDVLKYARENGCPWSGRTWYYAAESTKEWLEENGCPQEYVEDDEYSYSDDYSDDSFPSIPSNWESL